MSAKTRRFGVGFGLAGLLTALAGAPFLVSDVNAQGPGGPRMSNGRGPGGPGMFGQIMLGRLDLSDVQREQVKQIFESHRDEQAAIGERVRTAHKALETAVNCFLLVNEGGRGGFAVLADCCVAGVADGGIEAKGSCSPPGAG